MKEYVLFIQGGGQGAHDEDAVLVASLEKALGAHYVVRYPQMPNEGEPQMETWKTRIAQELAALHGEVILAGHSIGGAALLKYLAGERVDIRGE